jgi:hypothetical protein
MRVRIAAKTRKVAASTANRTVKLDGSLVLAISPPTRPPSPMPRFIVTRCCANAAGRRSAGVSADRSVPWLGQKAPLPVPASAFSRNACHAVVMRGKRAKAAVMITSAATRVVRAPIRSARAPAIGPETRAAAPLAAAINPASPSEIPRTLCR